MLSRPPSDRSPAEGQAGPLGGTGGEKTVNGSDIDPWRVTHEQDSGSDPLRSLTACCTPVPAGFWFLPSWVYEDRRHYQLRMKSLDRPLRPLIPGTALAVGRVGRVVQEAARLLDNRRELPVRLLRVQCHRWDPHRRVRVAEQHHQFAAGRIPVLADFAQRPCVSRFIAIET
jgi:hypothetical protein